MCGQGGGLRLGVESTLLLLEREREDGHAPAISGAAPDVGVEEEEENMPNTLLLLRRGVVRSSPDAPSANVEGLAPVFFPRLGKGRFLQDIILARRVLSNYPTDNVMMMSRGRVPISGKEQKTGIAKLRKYEARDFSYVYVTNTIRMIIHLSFVEE